MALIATRRALIPAAFGRGDLVPTDVPKSESDVLIAAYNDADGDNWTTNTGWTTDRTVGDWYGVTVSGGHVTAVDIGSNGLSQADVNAFLAKIYERRDDFGHTTPSLDVGGTNPEPSGTYKYSASPSTAKEYAYSLVNDLDGVDANSWTITMNDGSADVTLSEAIYYVDTGGDDGAGDGSSGSPWATIQYAMDNELGDGDTLLLGDGTYQEDFAGLGYLYLNDHFATNVTVRAENGASGDVTIQSSTATDYEVRFDGAGKMTFQYTKFVARTDDSKAAAYLGNENNVSFENCTFTVSGTGRDGVRIYSSDGVTQTNIVFDTCTFDQTGTNATDGLYAFEHANGAITGLTLRDCAVSVVGDGVEIKDAATVTVDNCTVTTTGTDGQGVVLDGVTDIDMDDCEIETSGDGVATVLRLGKDADTGNATSGDVTGCTLTANGSAHALLIGAASDGVTVSNCTINGGDQGLAYKTVDNITVSDCTITGGTSNAVYFKGAVTCTIEDSTIINDEGAALRVSASTARNSDDCTIQRCEITADGAGGSLVQWDTSEVDDGCVEDYNIYAVINGADWGDIFNTAIASLSDLQAAWATESYTPSDNDANSTEA